MNRKSLTLSVVALALSLGACNKDPAEERQEARREMGEALDDHAEKVNEAQEENEADKGKEITQANKELADKQKEAYDDVREAEENEADEMDPDRPLADKPDNVNESEKDVLANRFEAYKDETKAEFQTRAQARIQALEQELKSVEGSAPADRDDDLAAARTSLDEAKKDLNEVVSGTEEVFDDGKAGVAVAINKARRKVERVKEDVAK
jgi:cytochrome c556